MGMVYTFGRGATEGRYILAILALIVISFIAQASVRSAYRKYSKVPTYFGINSVDAAHRILASNGIYNVEVYTGGRELSDHFDPRRMVIRLGGSYDQMNSVAAVAVAAHECGHAIQNNEGYAFLKFRNALVPVVKITSNIALPMFIVGMIVGYTLIAEIAVIIFGVSFLFQLITLPVEFNASRRAVECLENCNLLTADEMEGAKKVLRAAAMTYVVATLMALVQFLRFLALSRRRR